ncbi:Glucan 1,3-beta-glucosidase 3 [Ceratobasidium sp. 394]|nr:Glucan 1,3-beta-glucosidase 3 [Ceratobasidium sp. 394]
MIVSATTATRTLVAALSLQQASYNPPPKLSTRYNKRTDATNLELGNQFLAGSEDIITTQGTSCKVEDYDAPNIRPPEFPPYDEKKARIYRYRKQLSVNLGSWFVQENWMKPSLVKCANGAKSAELDIASGWDNPASARSVLERHWDTWITEDDFAWLEKTGVNTVRLPIGYWSLGSQYCQGTPFEEVASVYERSWPRVLRAIDWAGKHNIGVLVDLHGAVGSQNGQSHSGTSDGQMTLFDDNENMKKTTDVLVYLTKQLVPISNVVGIQILNEPRNVASLPDFYGRTIDKLRKLSPDAAKFPFYIHDGFNLERFAKFVGGRKDFVVQDHHSYFVFTPSDASTSAEDHISNVNAGIKSALASASERARHNLVIDEWSCALTSQSLSSEEKPLAARKSFCTSQANVYLRETAGWSFWSYKTENCESEDGWCFRKAVGRSLPPKLSVWDMPETKKGGDDGSEIGLLGAVKDAPGGVLDMNLPRAISQTDIPAHVSFELSDKTNGGRPLAASSLDPSLRNTIVHDHPKPIDNITPVQDPQLDATIHRTAKDPTSSWPTPLGPPPPDVDDMMAASVVPDTDNTPSHALEGSNYSTISSLGTSIKRMFGIYARTAGSGSTAARRAAYTKSNGNKDKGYEDGYAAAVAFGEFGGSRLGFATQYMEDNIVALLTSQALSDGEVDGYRKGFVRGLADGEKKVIKDMSE